MTHHFIIEYNFGNLPVCFFGALVITALVVVFLRRTRREE